MSRYIDEELVKIGNKTTKQVENLKVLCAKLTEQFKKHLINHWRRDPAKPTVRALSPGKKAAADAGKFKIDLAEAREDNDDQRQDEAEPAEDKSAKAASQVLLPKTRGAGGIWLTQEDFPAAFQHIIVYHNAKKYSHCELH